MADSNRRVAIGIVTSDKSNKTRRVEIPRSVRHPRYGKYIRRKTVCHVHDEENDSRMGDTVEIVETRPLSKTKNWKLVRVMIRAPEVKSPGKEAAAIVGGTAESASDASPDETSADESEPSQSEEQ